MICGMLNFPTIGEREKLFILQNPQRQANIEAALTTILPPLQKKELSMKWGINQSDRSEKDLKQPSASKLDEKELKQS